VAGPETYELVPVTPIRRLEKELEKLKKQRVPGTGTEMTKQVIDILKMNQKIVNDMNRMQGELIGQLYKTNDKLSKLTDSVAELVVVLSGAAEEEVKETEEEYEVPEEEEEEVVEEVGVVDDKLERIIEQNTALINSLNVLGKELSKIEGKGE
jgi:chromosome segregation ATPase